MVSPRSSPQQHVWRRVLVAILIAEALAGGTVALYWPAQDFKLLGYDDRDDVCNDHIAQGLTPDTRWWALTTTERANWLPLTRLSLALDFHWVRDKTSQGDVQAAAPIVHWTNVGLHAANAVLLFLVLLFLTRSRWAAAVVAGLFAFHPLHVEAVAWAAERKDVLSTLFWFLTMWAYVWYARRPGVLRYLPVAVFLALGLMAKPMLVTLPFVLLLMDWWPLGRVIADCRLKIAEFRPGNEMGKHPAICDLQSKICNGSSKAPGANRPSFPWRTAGWLVLEKVPLFLMVIASSILTYIIQRGGGAMAFAEKTPLLTNLANVPVAYVTYLVRTFWPVGLAVFYPFPPELPLWMTLGSVAVLAAVTAAVIWQIRRRPYLAFGWFWYVGTLVPVIGFVQVGEHATADRYTYVPLVGIFIMICWGASDVAAFLRPLWRCAIMAPAAAGALAACVILTYFQLPYWTDTITLFNRDIAIVGDTSIAYYNIGDILLLQGDLTHAVDNYRKALDQQYKNSSIHNNLGWALNQMGKMAAVQGLRAEAEGRRDQAQMLQAEAGRLTGEAIMHFQMAIQFDDTNAGAHNNLGLSYFELGRTDDAIREYNEALRVNPRFAAVHINLAIVWMKISRYDKAAEQFQAALDNEKVMKPREQAYAHRSLGLSLAQLGRYREALQEYQAALKLRPDWAEVLIRQARLMATASDPAFRDGAEAVRLAEKVCFSPPLTEPLIEYDTLAAAYAEFGRFDLAVQAADKALEVAKAGGVPEAVKTIEAHLDAFKKGDRLREGPTPGRAAP